MTGSNRAPAYGVVETHTDALEASNRRDFWRDHVRSNHGGLESRFARNAAFEGMTVVQRSDGLQLMEFCSDAIEYESRAVDIRADDDRSLRVLIPRDGPRSHTVRSLWSERIPMTQR